MLPFRLEHPKRGQKQKGVWNIFCLYIVIFPHNVYKQLLSNQGSSTASFGGVRAKCIASAVQGCYYSNSTSLERFPLLLGTYGTRYIDKQK